MDDLPGKVVGAFIQDPRRTAFTRTGFSFRIRFFFPSPRKKSLGTYFISFHGIFRQARLVESSFVEVR